MNNESDKVADLSHNAQLPKNWVEEKVKNLYRVGFPVGLFQIVPVAWVVRNFVNSTYCTYPHLSIREDGNYAGTQKCVGDDAEDQPIFEDIAYRNDGTSVTVDSPSPVTTHEYAARLIEFVMKEKYRVLQLTSKYEEATKAGKAINWQFYTRNDNGNWVIIIPMSEAQVNKFLKLSTSTNYVLEPLKYELTGFAALRADSEAIAKAQAGELLNWLYKVRKPQAINPAALPERTIEMDYETYPTRDAALLALFKATHWDAGIYLSIFPTGNGRFYFTTDEKKAFAITDELEAKGIEWYHVCDDGSDEELTEKMEKWYKKELREEFDKVVPRTHPHYNALWKAHFRDLASCANGMGGFCSPAGIVEDCVGWVVNSKTIWTEVVTGVANSVLSAGEAKKLLKAWTKGKTAQECSGLTDKEWLHEEIYSEEQLREYAEYWAKEELGQEQQVKAT
jgi:hypothetical protein